MVCECSAAVSTGEIVSLPEIPTAMLGLFRGQAAQHWLVGSLSSRRVELTLRCALVDLLVAQSHVSQSTVGDNSGPQALHKPALAPLLRTWSNALCFGVATSMATQLAGTMLA